MVKQVIFFILSNMLLCNCIHAATFSFDTLLMGSSFIFTAVHEDPAIAKKAVVAAKKEVVYIESRISSWQPNSETSAINRNAGIRAVKVGESLFNLIERSIKVSNISEGYFDISFASINSNWVFDGRDVLDVDSAAIAASVQFIDFNKIVLNRDSLSVFLPKGMKIGFGAIGKGYAADESKKVMQSYGIQNGVVNAGGDLVSWGMKENGEYWSVGIVDPNDKNEIISSLNVTNQSVVTSGDYERYVNIGGVRYGHIINPHTGFPSKGVKSVTIITQTAEIGDALATSVFAMGEKRGIDLINSMKGVECIIVNDVNDFIYSDNINLQFVEND